MNESDDFFVSFKKQVERDIEEFLGLNSEHFGLSIWYSKLRRGGKSWKHLPHVTWTYRVVNPETDAILADYGGWMMAYGGNWGDLHNHIMEELGNYKDYREEKILEVHITNQPTNRDQEARTRYLILPFVGAEKEG